MYFTLAAIERGVSLFKQQVPAIYLRLEDVVRHLSHRLQERGRHPVMASAEFRMKATELRDELHGAHFRDLAELNQAVRFLHDNGVLLHYDDASLANTVFLDPQWLCDVLANVVTIREINPLARSGVMRAFDLSLLFKNARFRCSAAAGGTDDVNAWVIGLLSKFEVALKFNDEDLLIPSLLPTEEETCRRGKCVEVRQDFTTITVSESH